MFAFTRQTVCPQRRQANTMQTHIDVPEPKAEQTPRSNVYKTHSNVSGNASGSARRLLHLIDHCEQQQVLNDTLTAMCRTLHDRDKWALQNASPSDQ
jgi:hypothetical protein